MTSVIAKPKQQLNGHFDKDEVKRLAAGRWPEILTTVGGVDPQLLDGRNRPCPKCGGRDRFRCIDRDAGALYCNQCFNEKNGDGLAGIGWLCGVGFPEALLLVADHLGVPGTNGQVLPGDIIERVAQVKNMPSRRSESLVSSRHNVARRRLHASMSTTKRARCIPTST